MAEIYQRAEDRRPDEEFVPGELRRLRPGNEGRLLDGRRTPVRVVEVRADRGQFVVELLAFEDAGARWDLDLERVGMFQFEREADSVPDARLAELEASIVRFDRPLEVSADPSVRTRTEGRITERQREARDWLRAHSRFLDAEGALPDPATRRTSSLLLGDFERFLDAHGLADLDARLTTTFVSAPYGEDLKAHRIVLAELGLADYRGKIVRAPDVFDGETSRARREEHVVRRLAFLRALFAELGLRTVRLHRGISNPRGLQERRGTTWVSASFSRDVAEALAAAHGDGADRSVESWDAPVERLFITYLETRAMNRQYLEAEAVLLSSD